MRFATAAAFTSFLVLGCGPAPQELGEIQLPLYGGTFDPGDPSAVVVAGGGVWCSGSLVSPKVVLTAGHCISAKNNFVYFGSSYLSPGGVTLGISKSYTTPDYAQGFRGHDIGIVVMSDYSPETPMALNTAPLDGGEVGSQLRLIGFGETGVATDPFLQKDTVESTITTVTANEIQTASGICHGDSGGPGLLGQAIGGVVSWTSLANSCAGAIGGLTRVDVYASWIQQQIALEDPPSCALDGRCVPGCAPPDPDCACGLGDVGRACNDHNPCTSGETCDSSGNCSGGTLNPCDTPPNDCDEPAGACSAYGACVYSSKPDGAACNAGACQGGRCIPGLVPDSGVVVDAGPQFDAGSANDAGTQGDAGSRAMSDAGGSGPPPPLPAKGGCGCGATGTVDGFLGVAAFAALVDGARRRRLSLRQGRARGGGRA